jgi:hypothetical protein
MRCRRAGTLLEQTTVMRRAIFAVLFAVVCAGLFAALSTSTARAEPPAIDSGLAPERVSYRWQIVLADIAAVSAALVSAQPGIDREDEFRAAGYGTFALGAPIIHAANGHGRRAIGSLALRVGLPLLGAYVGAKFLHPNCPPDASLCGDAHPHSGVVIGVGAGVVTALIVDTWLLARPTVRSSKRGWSPTASTGNHSATVGVAGRF